MEVFNLEDIDLSELGNREAFLKLTLSLIKPLKKYLHRSDTRLHINNMSSGAVDQVSEIEGFARMIWALGAIRSEDMSDNDSLWQAIRSGIESGTNPDNPDYFGELRPYDQRLVETAAMGFAMVNRPKAIYGLLDKTTQDRFITWLRGIEQVEAHACNWKFFRVMVEIGLKSMGLSYDQHAMEAHLDEMDTYYIKDGWYADGVPGQAHVDYYIPFAMHYYGLFYAMHMKDVDPKRSQIYEERALAFAKNHIHWFAGDGAALPYGRSLTYRFAQVAFWSMLIVSGLELPFEIGVIKGIIMRHFTWWFEKPILDREGILTMGYAYPNQFMTEEYNAPGSVYWALKSMAILLLPKDHEFWQCEILPLPDLEDKVLQKEAKMVLCRHKSQDHLIAYTTGYQHSNGHTHVSHKYEKFAYSTLFGFSVPRGLSGLDSGGFDSMLAVSEDGRYFRHKEQVRELEINEKQCRMIWHPFSDVTIETQIEVGFPWHKRTHVITTGRKLVIADCGFALGTETFSHRSPSLIAPSNHSIFEDQGIALVSGESISGIVNLGGYDQVASLKQASGTNLMNPRTFLPYLKAEIMPGRYEFSSLVFGDRNRKGYVEINEIMAALSLPNQ